jgi:putative oxidoreductase
MKNEHELDERLELARRRAGDFGLLVLRLGAFLMIATYHVRPKLAHFAVEAANFPDPFGLGHSASFLLALVSEGGCAVLVAVGIATRAASLPILFTMATVLLLATRGFAGADVQAALLYALPYAALALLGPGTYSVDAKLAHVYLSMWERLRPRVSRSS